MAEQAKARHIGAGVDILDLAHRLRRPRVERCHALVGGAARLVGGEARLERGRDDADAEALGEHEHIARLRADIFENVARMDEARDAQAVLRLVVLNGMPAGDDAAGLHSLVVSALQNSADGIERKAARHAQEVHCELRHAAHGVHVRKGVCRGDLPEEVRIVHDGRKEVHRFDHGHVVRHAVNTGVVAAVVAHQQPRVKHIGKTL